MRKNKIVIVLSLIVIFPHQIWGDEALNILNQADKAFQGAARDGKALIHSLVDGHKKSKGMCADQASGHCGMNLKTPEQVNKGSKASAQMYIFVSSSMPLQSIKALGQEARKVRAHIVFRGLIGGTFKETQQYMMDLGIMAEIDPPKFDDFHITKVPTFILSHNNSSDRVMGHISLLEVLDQFRKKGELKVEAQEYYMLLRGERS
jgi:type-F conjugative transfer system pilin assembly protein TrbC